MHFSYFESSQSLFHIGNSICVFFPVNCTFFYFAYSWKGVTHWSSSALFPNLTEPCKILLSPHWGQRNIGSGGQGIFFSKWECHLCICVAEKPCLPNFNLRSFCTLLSRLKWRKEEWGLCQMLPEAWQVDLVPKY